MPTNMQIGAGSLGATPTQSSDRTGQTLMEAHLDTLASTNDRLRSHVDRTELLVERLLGTFPEGVGTEGPNPEPSGLLGQLDSRVADTSELLARLDRSLDRLQTIA